MLAVTFETTRPSAHVPLIIQVIPSVVVIQFHHLRLKSSPRHAPLILAIRTRVAPTLDMNVLAISVNAQ